MENTRWQSFVRSFSVIVVSEIGDKTFLIAAIMAMRHPRYVIFSAAAAALAIMTVLSAGLGYALPHLLSRTYTQYAAALLFLVFGAKMIVDGWSMAHDEGLKEMEEVDAELNHRDAGTLEEGKDASPSSSPTPGSRSLTQGVENLAMLVFSPVFVQTFVMTFLAEWGDRSQITTIALAAADNVVWVTIGAILGHCLCTGAAVVGGRMLAQRISVRTVTLVGGVLFLIFALTTFHGIVYGEPDTPKPKQPKQ